MFGQSPGREQGVTVVQGLRVNEPFVPELQSQDQFVATTSCREPN